MNDTINNTSKKRKPTKELLPGQKRIRRSTKQVMQENTNKMLENQRIDKAFIKACFKYEEEKGKKNGLSAAKIAQLYSVEYNVNLCARTIQKYVKDGKIGQGLQKRGPSPAGLSEASFALLTEAFETHVRLNQVNQDGHKKITWRCCIQRFNKW